MSPSLMGAIAGAALGLAGFGVLRTVAAAVEAGTPGEEGRRKARLLRLVGLVDIVVMTLAGAFLGPIVLGEAG